MIAFEIEGTGEHTVRLKYAPKTFTLGLTISILSALLFVMIIVLEKPITAILSKVVFPKSQSDFEENELPQNESDIDDIDTESSVNTEAE